VQNLLVGFLRHKRPMPSTPLSDFDRLAREIKPGDVMLVEGRSRVSDVIRWVTQSAWSHAALYLGRPADLPADIRRALKAHWDGPEDTQLIIESELGLGTVVRSLDNYRGEHLRVCRPRALTAAGREKALAYAIGRLGTQYDVRQIFDLLRFLFPWFIMPRRWRSSLFSAGAGRSTHTVCSTMIAEAFAAADFPILPLVKLTEGGRVHLYRRNPRLCTPRDFDYSPYFDIIKYPYVDLRRYAREYLEEWDGGAGLSKQEAGVYLLPDDAEQPGTIPSVSARDGAPGSGAVADDPD
jgi:hypothetical protein